MRVIISICLIVLALYSTRLDQVSNIVGVRDNQLFGYGIIVGLDGTGDSSSPYTRQTLASMLQGANVQVNANAINSKNIAAVVITANLPPFARQGDKIDISVSSIGDSKSLKGGTLIMAPLKGVDGKIYALAQGNLNLSVANNGDPDTTATIARGAIVEREVKHSLYDSQEITLTLKHSNFDNANNIEGFINSTFESNVARAIDSRTIKLFRPKNVSPVAFIAKLNNIKVSYYALDKIVVDSESGTIVAGLDVEVEPVLITHKDITVKIVSTFVLVPSDNDIGDGVTVNREQKIVTTTSNPTIASVARALQKLGATPKDIIAIFTAMRKAGAIVVDIEVI